MKIVDKIKDFFTKEETSKEMLEAEKMAVLEEMAVLHADTEEYKMAVNNFECLCRAEGQNVKKPFIEGGDIIKVVSTVGVVCLILVFESQDNIIRTKALSFIPKVL